MNEQEVFIGTEEALSSVVEQIKSNQWALKMPPEFQRRDRKDITLRQIINYHAYDDIWVPETLSGKTIEEVGHKYDGDLLGDNPLDAWHEIVAASIEAVRSCDPEKIVHLTYGDYPAREYLVHASSFRGLRAVDIARFIGVSDRLPEELVQGLWDELSPDAEAWRQMGVYGPEVPVPAGADLQARLMGLTGRQP